MPLHAKDPSATLDYSFDWSDWLQGAEAITSTNWSVTPTGGLTLGAETAAGNTRGVFVSSGTLGARYRLTCQIETDLGRTAEQSLAVRVMEE